MTILWWTSFIPDYCTQCIFTPVIMPLRLFCYIANIVENWEVINYEPITRLQRAQLFPMQKRTLQIDTTSRHLRVGNYSLLVGIRPSSYSGGSRISPRWGANSGGGGANIRFCQNFPKTAWNWKNLDPRGGASPAPPFRSTSLRHIVCIHDHWQEIYTHISWNSVHTFKKFA